MNHSVTGAIQKFEQSGGKLHALQNDFFKAYFLDMSCLGVAFAWNQFMANGSKQNSSRPDDDKPFPIEALSHYARVSQAILRLCIANGCPAPNSKLSQNAFIEWLCHHYSDVRAIAGLPPLAPLDGTRGSVRQTLQLSNTMLTLLEFAESRSSSVSEKAHIRTLVEFVQRAV